MHKDSNDTAIAWNDLVRSLAEQKCVLFIGPDLLELYIEPMYLSGTEKVPQLKSANLKLEKIRYLFLQKRGASQLEN